MKGMLHLAKRFLANHPGLRRKVVSALYRIPMLDMRLRAALGGGNGPAWQPVDINDLTDDVQAVYERLHYRMKQK